MTKLTIYFYYRDRRYSVKVTNNTELFKALSELNKFGAILIDVI